MYIFICASMILTLQHTEIKKKMLRDEGWWAAAAGLPVQLELHLSWPKYLKKTGTINKNANASVVKG